MALLEITELPAKGALLGLDPGTRTIGVAVSDATQLIASPVETIQRSKKLAPSLQRLFEIYDERLCKGIVIGMPLNLNGEAGPRAQSVRAFARNLSHHRDVPYAYWDERLSTQAVERTLLEADASRARRSEVVDKMAAAFILQGAIDRLAEREE